MVSNGSTLSLMLTRSLVLRLLSALFVEMDNCIDYNIATYRMYISFQLYVVLRIFNCSNLSLTWKETCSLSEVAWPIIAQ